MPPTVAAMSRPERRQDLALQLGATKTVKLVTNKWGNEEVAFETDGKETFSVSKTVYFKLRIDKDLIAAEFARLQAHRNDPKCLPRWDNRIVHEIDNSTGGRGNRWVIRWVRIKPEWIRGRPPPEEIWTLDMRRWFKTPETSDWQMVTTTGFYFTLEEWQEFYYEIEHMAALLKHPPLSAEEQIAKGNKQVEEEYNNSARKRLATSVFSGPGMPLKKRSASVGAKSSASGGNGNGGDGVLCERHLQELQDLKEGGGDGKKKKTPPPRVIQLVSPAKAAKIRNLLGICEPVPPNKQLPETVLVPTRLMNTAAENLEEEEEVEEEEKEEKEAKSKVPTAGEKKEQQQPKQHPKAAAATVEKGKRRGTTPKQQPLAIPRRGPAKKPASTGRRGQQAKTMANQQQQEQVTQRNTDGEDQKQEREEIVEVSESDDDGSFSDDEIGGYDYSQMLE